MVFGSEAMLPVDIAFQSSRVESHDEERSNVARELEVNYAKEQRIDTCACMAKYLKACIGTITTMSRIDSSWSAIWFHEGSRRQKDCIS
jgi:ribosomal protein L17